MKTVKIIFLLLLLAMTSNIHADELYVTDFFIMPGESKTVSVELTNPDHTYNALQFVLTLPSGLSIAKTSEGKLAVVPNSERLADFSININEVGEGVYQFLIYIIDQDTFISGTSSEIFSIILTASADAETGSKQGIFSEQLFVIDEEGYEPADKTFNIRIGSIPGDANGDEVVSIADAVAAVNYILTNGQPTGNFVFGAANMDDDEIITIADAIAIVNKILALH